MKLQYITLPIHPLLLSLQLQAPKSWKSPPTWLIEWLCSLTATVKAKTMKLYLAGIKSYQLDLGIDLTAFIDPRLKRTIQGIKREHAELASHIRSSLTRPLLLRILTHLHFMYYDTTALWAAFTLAFAGFLWVGEFTYQEADRQLASSFPKWLLSKKSIQVSNDGMSMELTIPASKTDPFRKGITLTIATTQDEGCPVDAIKQLQIINNHRPQYRPLFYVRKYG